MGVTYLAPARGRRWMGPSADWGLYGLLVVIGVACHLNWAVTERIQVDLHPLPWMLAVYVGYKMGRWSGFAAGGLSVLPWTVYAALTDRRLSWRDLVLGGGQLEPFAEHRYLTVRMFSLQEAAVAGLLGFLGGWVFDLFERRLNAAGWALDDLLPQGRRRGPLAALFPWSSGGSGVPRRAPWPRSFKVSCARSGS